ncbi:hypothetical protein ABIE19_001506 [Brevundimonas faecalis]|uniref:TonB family protein n=1 Tax=Brevundimonas faecalis TaxID=947378 RepID=A0ABV2RAK2_9CAUL
MRAVIRTVSLIPIVLFGSASQAAEDAPVAWAVRPIPTPDDFPPFAAALGVNGWAEVNCRVTNNGLPNACTAVRARPDGLGFAEAAVRVIERARLSSADTSADGREFTVRVPFQISPLSEEATPPWTGPTPNALQLESGRRYARRGVEPIVRLRRQWRLNQMPPEMRRTTEGWISELFGNVETDRQRRGLNMARVLAARGLDVMPPKQPDDWTESWVPQLNQASRDLHPREPMNELRRRFCARYDCGPTAETVATPE